MNDVPDDFGTMLMLMMLAKGWSHEEDDGSREYATWEDVSEIMFDVAKMAHKGVREHDMAWRPESVEALDQWLMDVSESGQFEGQMSGPPVIFPELYRRARYAVAAAELENLKGPPLMLPLPLKAPDGLKGMALALYILGGPARDYPDQFAD